MLQRCQKIEHIINIYTDSIEKITQDINKITYNCDYKRLRKTNSFNTSLNAAPAPQ